MLLWAMLAYSMGVHAQQCMAPSGAFPHQLWIGKQRWMGCKGCTADALPGPAQTCGDSTQHVQSITPSLLSWHSSLMCTSHRSSTEPCLAHHPLVMFHTQLCCPVHPLVLSLHRPVCSPQLLLLSPCLSHNWALSEISRRLGEQMLSCQILKGLLPIPAGSFKEKQTNKQNKSMKMPLQSLNV